MALYNTTTSAEFKEKVLKSKKVVLVDFWAEWCPPCRAMAPALHSIAESMDKDVDVVKINIEDSADNTNLAREYGVQSIPNMNVFKDGNVVDQIIGLVPGTKIEYVLTSHIDKK